MGTRARSRTNLRPVQASSTLTLDAEKDRHQRAARTGSTFLQRPTKRLNTADFTGFQQQPFEALMFVLTPGIPPQIAPTLHTCVPARLEVSHG